VNKFPSSSELQNPSLDSGKKKEQKAKNKNKNKIKKKAMGIDSRGINCCVRSVYILAAQKADKGIFVGVVTRSVSKLGFSQNAFY